MNGQMILSVGMPRAGSGWFYNITQDLVVAAGGTDSRIIRSKYGLTGILTEVNCNLGTLSPLRLLPALIPMLFEPGYVLKLHAERRGLADLFIRLGIIKPTYIFRDPRDALLSAYEYGRRMSAKGLTNAFTPLDTIEKAIDFMVFYVQISRGWINMPGTLVVKYEELKKDYDQEVKRLIDFLGIDIPNPNIQEVIDKYRPDKKPPGKMGLHFVKGKIGRHQELFTPAQLQLCQDRFGDFLEEQGFLD